MCAGRDAGQIHLTGRVHAFTEVDLDGQFPPAQLRLDDRFVIRQFRPETTTRCTRGRAVDSETREASPIVGGGVEEGGFSEAAFEDLFRDDGAGVHWVERRPPHVQHVVASHVELEHGHDSRDYGR